MENSMKIEDRIQNIKTLLKYCPHSSVDVRLHDLKNAKFFAKFFNNDDRFESCKYGGDELYIKIELAKHVLTWDKNNKVIDEYPIMVSYCYDSDRDGEDWVSYYFDEPLVRNNWMFESDMYHKDFIKFEEWPDEVWERIQNELFDIARTKVDENVTDAFRTYKFLREKRDEFYTNLKLNEN